MDILSVLGLLLAVSAILVGNMLEGGHPASLVQLAAFMIVIGGTVGATMLQTPWPIFKRALFIAKWAFIAPREDDDRAVKTLMEWSHKARKDGLLGLEEIMENESDPFIRKGLQLVIDGNGPEGIRKVLEVDLVTLEHHDLQAAKVFEGMGGYAPTLGILGAVLGLIHVMNNLADPSKLGGGIAVAFVATVYGVGFANILFLPMANKLKALVKRQGNMRELWMEGLAAIAEGENPRLLETKLKGYVV